MRLSEPGPVLWTLIASRTRPRMRGWRTQPTDGSWIAGLGLPRWSS